MRTDTTLALTYYFQQDHEGSVTHLTNGSGTVIEKYQYDAFGAPVFYNGSGGIISGTAYTNPFLFTGRRYQATFGIYEYRARAYHPRLGRFTSEDPTLFDAGDYNLFRYCHNDPLDLTDPMGTLEQYHAELAHSPDRLWEMTKWFDSSNLKQGNFPGFGGVTTGVTVTGQNVGGQVDYSRAKRGNPNDRDAPAMVEILANKTQDFGDHKVYYLQTETKNRGA
ncbi:MAG: RHS repeat-associated core domain-containing protein [Chthoniobacterales bacterium]